LENKIFSSFPKKIFEKTKKISEEKNLEKTKKNKIFSKSFYFKKKCLF